MTEEATNEMENESNPTIADSDQDFHAKLNAIIEGADEGEHEVADDEGKDPEAVINDGEQQEEMDQDEHQEEDIEEDDYVPDDKNPIPYGRWKKMVERKNALAAEREAEKEKRMRSEMELDNYRKAMDEYFESMKPPQGGDKEEAPVDDIDPLDETTHKYYMQNIDALKKEIEELKGTSATKQDINTQRAAQQFEADVKTQRAAFEASTPDYSNALAHLQNIKMNEKLMLTNDKNQAGNAALQDILAMATSAYKNGKNVPEAIYNFAKMAGYTPAAPNGKANIGALKDNMKRGASDSSSRAAVPLGTSHYTQPGYLKKLKGADGAIEGAKFHDMLNKIIKG